MFSLALLAVALLLPAPRVQCGADQILQPPFLQLLKGKRVGLITNQTGVNSRLVSTVELLRNHPEINLRAVFSPEHGLKGDQQAGESLASAGRVYSLYGETRAPSPEMLRELDVLVFDIQDVGVRFYTYISTLFECMKAASREGVPLVILDRPVPISGDRVEGPVLEAGFESFVGIFPLPIRYGMTVGELGRLLNSDASLNCDLTIVPLKGWKRTQWYDQTGLPWVIPSPNMPTLSTATVYPGFCLIEGTNLSEGRGTTLPFELFGAPWLGHRELVTRLNELGLPGVRFRSQSFTPTMSKYQGESCRGVQVHVLDRDRFQPIETLLHVLEQVRRLHPEEFRFLDSFDRLAGNSWVRKGLLEGQSAAELKSRWQDSLSEFKQKRKRYLIY